jgi:ribonuclease P protein component
VRDRRSFGALREDGVRRRSGPITMTVVSDGSADIRVAYAINRSVGSAVRRNRLRRRVRAIVREIELAPGIYLIGVTAAAAALSHDELAAHVRTAARA